MENTTKNGNTFKSFSLKNGLQVILVSKEDSETVACSLMGKAGSMYERGEEIGAAHFLEHIVLEGSKDYPSSDKVSEIVENVGGIHGAATNKDIVQYWTKTLSEYLEQSLIYLSQVALFPLIADKDVEKHKKIIEQEILRFKASPENYLPRLAYQGIFPNQRIGGLNTGDIDDIKKITSNVLRDYLRRMYKAPSFVLVICGRIPKTAQELVGKYFNDMPAGRPEEISVVFNTESSVVIENRPHEEQVAIQISFQSFTGNTDENYVAKVISYILGAGKLSRLRKKIREEYALAYRFSMSQFTSEQFGIMSISAGIAEKNMELYIQLVMTELKELSKYGPSEEELKRCTQYARSIFAFMMENPSNIASYYGRKYLLGDQRDEMEMYKKLTSYDVKDIARRIFDQPPQYTAIGKTLNEKIFKDHSLKKK